MTQYRRQGELLEEPIASGFGRRMARWLAGWVLAPALLLTMVFILGMHWGVRHPDSQWISLTRWIAIHVFDEPSELFSDAISGEEGVENPAAIPPK